MWQAHRENKAALALCMGLITESLERRVDEVLALLTRPRERNEILSQQVQELEQEVPEPFWLTMKPESNATTTSGCFESPASIPWRIPGAEDEAG